MRSLTVGLILFAAATSATAQDGLRESDIKLSQDELTSYLSGHVLAFYSDGIATYQSDGIYTYQYSAEGNKVPGLYEVKDDGSVCTRFDNGRTRCDYIVQSGARHVMIIENGDRYPIKTRSAIE